ncbi:hypothetical protein GW17_00044980 [Ensete ventricosum]|nr:hypothetical protein GW17_00044980 [Ensete ventricosum]
MRLGTRLECIGSSPRVLEVCQDGAREFARRGSRLIGRLLGVAEKLIGTHREFARTSPKVSGRLLGTRWEIARGRP